MNPDVSAATEPWKIGFHLLQTRTAGRDRWFFRLILAAMCQHIDAWATHVTAPAA